MRAGLLIFPVFLGGCHLFFGSSTPDECRQDVDCLMGQICESGRCVTGSRPPDPDMKIEDAALAVVDLAVPDAAIDAAIDAMVDATVDAVVDAAPDLGPREVFAAGRCFDQPSDVWVTAGADDTHVPRGICTPWAVAWTAGRPGGAVLRLLRQAGDPTAAVDGPAVLPESPLATDGRFLVFLGPDPQGVPTAQRLDLQGETAVPLSAAGLPNRDVARAPGVSAHVEVAADAAGVVLTFDDDTYLACRRAGQRQWGVALGGGRAAWFEAPLAGTRPTLVVTDGLACEPRVVRPLDGAVADDARIAAAGGGFFWIEQARGADRPEVVGLRPDRRGRLRPFPLPGDGAPVELVGEGDRLAVVRYQPGRYVLDLIEASTGDAQPVSSVSARHPALWGGWLMWAQAATFAPWELRYVDLATLR